MELQAIYDDLESIPEQYRDLYAQKTEGGKYEVVGIVGLKTQGDVDRLSEALKKEREDHKAAKSGLSVWDGLNHDDVRTKLDHYDEMVTKIEAFEKEGGVDKDKLEELANARLATAMAPVKRELDELHKENDQLREENEGFKAADIRRKISDSVRAAAVKAKVLPAAVDDVLLLAERVFEITEDGEVLTRDSVGVTPGIAADIWLTEMQPNRSHWWPMSEGGGARGGGGGNAFANNPWSAQHWSLTNQGRVLKEQGRDKAEQMARAAGSHIGATAPVKKSA